jgi:hypothetical protein
LTFGDVYYDESINLSSIGKNGYGCT